ncbi:MAG: helix-turn-helix domain-containing protein [Clostridiales bacterium]|nr:helix-turn-helix domain-containing protein [Clostridiales bacterium]
MLLIQKNSTQASKSVPFLKNLIFSDPNSEVDCHLYSKPETCFHRHIDYYEFCLITQGQAWYYNSFTKKKTLVSKNYLLFTKAGDSHQFFKADGPTMSQINISISVNQFEQLLRQLDIRITTSELSPISVISNTTSAYLSRLSAKILTSSQKEYVSFLIKQWIMTALTSIFSYKEFDTNFPQWFLDILLYMQKTSSLEKKLKELMPHFNYSAATLNKYFKEYLNTTPNEYFLQQKLHYAKQLLRSTDFSILEISLSIGFDSLSHFIHFFKEQTQMTPLAYRKQFSSTDYQI